jgi:hypothetical protein
MAHREIISKAIVTSSPLRAVLLSSHSQETVSLNKSMFLFNHELIVVTLVRVCISYCESIFLAILIPNFFNKAT